MNPQGTYKVCCISFVRHISLETKLCLFTARKGKSGKIQQETCKSNGDLIGQIHDTVVLVHDGDKHC